MGDHLKPKYRVIPGWPWSGPSPDISVSTIGDQLKPTSVISGSTIGDQLKPTSVISGSTNGGPLEPIPVISESAMGDDKGRVLCMDGGGIRGLVILEILEAIEEAADQKPIIELFDWIGGTSTGGIIALGIATGKKISEIKDVYDQLKDQVFKGRRPYNSTIIEDLLKQQFGETKKMTEIKGPKVVVTSVLGDHRPWKLHLFRSYEFKEVSEPERLFGDAPIFKEVKTPQETCIWEAARSTSAAPTYFHPFGQFLDGGLMSNNPTLDILTEINRYSQKLDPKWRPKVVVSIGCGYVDDTKTDIKFPVEPSMKHPWKTIRKAKHTYKFGMELVDQAMISHGQPSYRARAWCEMMDAKFFRFSPPLPKMVPLNCVDDETLEEMLDHTREYAKTYKYKPRIQKLANLLMGKTDQSVNTKEFSHAK